MCATLLSQVSTGFKFRCSFSACQLACAAHTPHHYKVKPKTSQYALKVRSSALKKKTTTTWSKRKNKSMCQRKAINYDMGLVFNSLSRSLNIIPAQAACKLVLFAERGKQYEPVLLLSTSSRSVFDRFT